MLVMLGVFTLISVRLVQLRASNAEIPDSLVGKVARITGRPSSAAGSSTDPVLLVFTM